MSDAPKITVKAVVVCDEVRREDNGKEILIGVYSSGVLVPQFPAPLNFTFWVQFTSTGLGQSSLMFRVMGGEDVKFAEIRVDLNLIKSGLGSMAIGPVPVMLQIATSLTLQMKQGEHDDWLKIEEIVIDKGPAVNPLTGAPVPLVRREYVPVPPKPATD